jgi:hypothetical protein
MYGLFFLPFSETVIKNASANPRFVLILSLCKVPPDRIQNYALFSSDLCPQLIESSHKRPNRMLFYRCPFFNPAFLFRRSVVNYASFEDLILRRPMRRAIRLLCLSFFTATVCTYARVVAGFLCPSASCVSTMLPEDAAAGVMFDVM